MIAYAHVPSFMRRIMIVCLRVSPKNAQNLTRVSTKRTVSNARLIGLCRNHGSSSADVHSEQNRLSQYPYQYSAKDLGVDVIKHWGVNSTWEMSIAKKIHVATISATNRIQTAVTTGLFLLNIAYTSNDEY